ncbi:Hypothetical protein D9617_16g015170 [Elsinoe fawcettii]|nr:Hypothetical protein D9617_16g015170 [Elsinoe fawcettii]
MPLSANLTSCASATTQTNRPKSIGTRAGLVSIEDSFTLTNNSEKGNSEVVLDYGRAEGGYPVFGVEATAANGEDVRFRVIYSETRAGVDSEEGDGPYFLFSNAMDTYRSVEYKVPAVTSVQYYQARFAQGSQRYQKIILLTSNASLKFETIGLEPLRQSEDPRCHFSCSDPALNQIWDAGLRTVDMCTVVKEQTRPAWDFPKEGTRVFGQHWAPIRQGTRWKDIEVRFEVKVDQRGASWGVHMVANGLIFCLDVVERELRAYEGLADKSSIFPTRFHGRWQLEDSLDLENWISVVVQAYGNSATVSICGKTIATLDDLDMHPLLGGAPNNSGSFAFGGPAEWIATYRDLAIHDLTGNELYKNSLLPDQKQRTMLDFAVGTNTVACTIDGAKRDRSVFGGDLFVMGQALAYSTGQLEAIKGSISLLTSHQTEDGYLGNLCPIQAPLHDSEQDPPTYAFYSIEYSLLLVTAIKDYWLHSGDETTIQQVWPKLCKLLSFVQSFMNEQGLINAPPPLSLTFLPLGGPIFGPAAHINLAYYQALLSTSEMSTCISGPIPPLTSFASDLKTSIKTHFYSPKTNLLSPSLTQGSYSQQTLSHAICLDLIPPHPSHLPLLSPANPPAAFPSCPPFPSTIVSPFTSAFAAEALLTLSHGAPAISLIKKIWGPMTNEDDADYSGCLWEAMTVEGRPAHKDTSLCHGWSTGPVYLLPKYLAGVRPTEAGWRRWEVRPVWAGVREVEVGMETVRGRVGVRVDWGDEGEGRVEVDVQGDSEVDVVLPEGWRVVGGEKTGMKGPGRLVLGIKKVGGVDTPVLDGMGKLSLEGEGKEVLADV